MALQLTQVHKGVSCNYWKVLSYTPNTLTGATHVMMGLYVSKDIRDVDPENSILKETHKVQGADLHLDEVYPKLKEDISYQGRDTDEESDTYGEEITLYRESKFKNAVNILEED